MDHVTIHYDYMWHKWSQVWGENKVCTNKIKLVKKVSEEKVTKMYGHFLESVASFEN